MLRILAIVSIRNEEVHIKRCLSHLIGQGCDVCLIDHGSSDESVELASKFLGKGLVRIHKMEWLGQFSIIQQLKVKRSIIEAESYDWIIHADADEWLVSPTKGKSLRDEIIEADLLGYNAINFHEIVFVPMPGQDFYRSDYASFMKNYYFFQPTYPRLQRAWKLGYSLSNVEHAGHILKGEYLALYPRDLILRHYIVLSQEHAIAKYLDRKFDETELNNKLHINRIIKHRKEISLRMSPLIKQIEAVEEHDKFDLGSPTALHFWQWN